MLYQRSYSHRNKTVVLQPRKLQEVYVVQRSQSQELQEVYQRSYPQKQNRGIIAKKTTGSLCCTRGHTSTETKPWYYSQENYRKSMLYQRSYSHRNKTVVLQPRKLQEVYVVPEVILPQKQNRGIIAKKTTGSLCCTRGHTPTETKPWYYSQENYRKSMLYQRSYSHRNKTVVLQPRKLQEVYVVPEVILPQKQNRGIIAKKTTGSLCCTRGHTPTETKPWYYSQENYRKSMLYQRSYSYRNKTVVLQPRKLKLQDKRSTSTETKPLLQPRKLPEVILLQKQNRGIIAKKTTGSLCCTRGHTPTETKPWYYSQENYRKSMLYQRSYSHRNKTVVLQPRKLQEVYVVPEVILPQKQNRGIIAKKTTGSLCCTRGHTPTETKPWYYSQENYRKSMLYQRSYSHRNKTVVLQPRKLQEVYVVQRSYSHRNKTVVLQPRKLQEVYVVPEVILPQKQNRGIIAKKTTGSLCCTRGHTPTETKPWYYSQENYRKSMLYQRSYSHRNKTVVLQPRKLQEVYVVPEVILPQKQNRGIIAKKTTGSLSCTRGHTPTETKPWYYSQENYRKSMLYQRSYSHRNKTVVLQPRKLQEVYVVPEVILPQKQNRGIIAKKTTGSLCCTRGHTPTETKPWYYSQENYRKSMLYQRSYSHRNKTVVLQPRKLQEVYSQENYRKSMLYQRSYSHRNKTVVLQPRKLQEVYVVLILLQKQNRGIIAKKTTGSLCCTRGHTPTETKPWYYSQENYRKSMLYQRSYSHRNKTVVLQPRKLQEVYVVPEVILPQKQNRGIIAKKTTGSLCCTRGHTPTETKPWYYSQENYRKSMLYQRSYSHRNKTVVLQPRKLQEVYVVPEVILHRNKTVVLQPRKLQEVYVVPEVILPQKQNRGIIAKKTTGSLCCTRGHTPTETKPWYYSQENYRKSKLYQRSYSTQNRGKAKNYSLWQRSYSYRNRGNSQKTTGSLCCTRGHTPTETKPWYYSQENYRKSMLYQRSYSHRNKTVVLQPRKLQEVYVVPEVILPQKQNRGIIAKKTTGSLCCTRGHTPTETKPWYYSQENYRKSMLYQRSYSHRNKTVVLQPRKLQEVYCTRGHTPTETKPYQEVILILTETKPWYYSQENYRKSMLYQRSYSHRNKTVVLQPRKLQEVYVVPEVILPQKQNRGIIAKKTTGSLCCTRGHTPTETKPWYYSQENYRKSKLYQRSYSHRNKTVVLQPRKLQEVYVVPEVILPQKQNRGIIAKKTTGSLCCTEVILPQKQNRGIIAKKTTGSLCCTRGHTPTETKPWYYSQENYRKSMLYQRSYSHRNKTVVLQPRKLQEVYVVPEVILPQKQNRGIIAKKTTGSLCCTRGHTPTETKPWYYSQENYRKSMLYRGHTPTETKPWYYSQENYRKSMLYQRSYSHRNKTVVLQPRKLQEVYVVPEVILLQKQNRGIIAKKTTGSLCCTRGHTPTETKPWYYSQENYRKSMLYQRSYSHRNKTVVLQPEEVYCTRGHTPTETKPWYYSRGIIAKNTTGSLCCTRGHTPTETKPWYYSQENYRKSMLYQRSYSHRNKTVVLQPRKLQEVYVVPEVILPQKQNRGIIAKKTTGSLCCTRGHTPTETKPWYYSQENYRKSMLYQRSYSHRNKTVVLQPRKLQEVYVVSEVILPQIIAKSLCCTRGHTPTETKPWYYSQENYRKSKLYQRSYSHRNKTVVLQPRKLQEVYVVPEVILPQKQNRGIIAKKTTGSLCCTRGHTPTETKPWYYSQENYRKSMLYQRSYSHRNKTVVLQPRKLQEVYVVPEVILPQKQKRGIIAKNYRKSMLYQRSYSHRNKTVVLQPRKLQEVYVVPEVILPQKQNRGIIAKKTTGSLCCTRGHTPTETKPWYYSQENYRKSMLYQRSYSHRNKTVVLQPRKLQEVYVVPEVILPQKQNRGIIAKKTTGSLCCTRGHTPTETKPWYYSQENYRKSMLYQRSYSHRNKTVVLQPRKLQEV